MVMAVREWRKCVSCVQYWVVSVDGGKTWKGGASCGQAPWSCLVREREHKHRADMSGARTRLEYLVAELKGQQRRRHSLSVPCMYRNHQNSTNSNLSMLRCSPYFETSIRHVMLLLKTVCPRSVLPKASIFQVVIPSSFIKKKTPFLPCHQNPIQTPEWKKSYLVIQKLPSIALSTSVRTKLHVHNRNSRNDQENKSLIPYYKKIIPIPPSFFCTLLFGVSVFSFFYFLPLHVLHLDHDKNKRKKGCASADAVITNMW